MTRPKTAQAREDIDGGQGGERQGHGFAPERAAVEGSASDALGDGALEELGRARRLEYPFA
jgi:hypothetical protein